MDDASDQVLVALTRQGENDAFGELVRRYQSSVFGVCYRLMGERQEAEDMAQEAFLRAYQRLHRYDVNRPFGPWMRRVAANVCLNRLQQHQPLRVTLEEETDTPILAAEGGPESQREDREQSERLWEAIGLLSARQRAVIELRHFHAMSYEEIAGELRISLAEVKTHLFRARRALARRIGNA
jgi:RNA polymerase sigma-70 factor (ECF subfamily)